jgi:hypothetical protein
MMGDVRAILVMVGSAVSFAILRRQRRRPVIKMFGGHEKVMQGYKVRPEIREVSSAANWRSCLYDIVKRSNCEGSRTYQGASHHLVEGRNDSALAK